jgi:hypothetical protein
MDMSLLVCCQKERLVKVVYLSAFLRELHLY